MERSTFCAAQPLVTRCCGMLVATVTGACMLIGCDRAVTREREAARALVDSVASLEQVRRVAPEHLAGARTAIARAESLLVLRRTEDAREGFAEATVLARLAVVQAEGAARIDSADGTASAQAAKDSV